MIADMRRLGVDVSRFAAALTVFAFGGNVDIAAYTAGNTAQNNMLFLLFFALDAAGVIWTAYDIYNTISEIQEAIENGQDPSTIVQEKLVDLAFSLSLGKIQKSVIAAKSTAQLIINIRKHLEDVAPYLVTKFDDLARQLSKMADGTQPDTGTGLNPETADVNHWVPGTDGKIVGDVVNSAGRQIVLKNGFYEVEGGMKISQNYYENLWKNGRPAPFIQAEEILKSKPKVTLDPKERPGFQRYEANGLEMIFNPTTKEIWHIQPVKK